MEGRLPDGLLRRLDSLSLEDKVRLLTGADAFTLHGCFDLGLRPMVCSDGPAGVRGPRWDERDQAANVPSATALAATWDPDRIAGIGRLLASEAMAKGVDILLAPTVNLQRTPYGGRNFECFSEDPVLTGVIGSAFVRGLQECGVAATVKHFVGNDSETQRFTVDVHIDQRVLRELYLAPFEAIVDAGVWAVMSSYNAVNGTTMTEHPMLRGILEGEFGFDGVVMSDWGAARSAVGAGNAGLDLVMPGPVGPWGQKLVDAVRAGEVPEDVVDAKVRRLLLLASRVGALAVLDADRVALEDDGAVLDAAVLDTGRVGFDAAAPVMSSTARRTALTPQQVATRLRSAAAAGFVLVRNEGPLLPLEASALRRVAVLGPNAATARTLGGGSATVFPPYTVSPVDGLRAALGQHVEVVEAVGARNGVRTSIAPISLLRVPGTCERGLLVRLLAADGTQLHREHRWYAQLNWSDELANGVMREDVDTIELTAAFTPTQTGEHIVGCSGAGRFELTVNDQVCFSDVLRHRPEADPSELFLHLPQWSAPVSLEAGREVRLRLRYRVDGDSAEALRIALNLDTPIGTVEQERAAAVELARSSDVAVVVVGTTEEVECEGVDRCGLALPGAQDELVRAVLEANPRTVVVVNSGAPVLMPWLEQVPAVLLSWFPGQEFGNALADVLLGLVEPGGRTPITWPDAERDLLAAVAPVDGVLDYAEGLHIGHRAWLRAGVEPAVAFGHGNGYTTWEYLDLDLPERVGLGDDLVLRVRVRNVGPRDGREVVQVYASREHSALERPVRWLAGFATVDADAGDTATAEIRVPARALQHWDTASGSWAGEPGPFQFRVGRSVTDLRLGAEVEVG